MDDAAGQRRLSVRFWGVRGGVPAPGPETVRYGGNTACIEVRCDGRLLILDAGSGLRRLGDALLAGQEPVQAEVLCSHTHLDHVCGLPFFAPLYQGGTRLRLWSGHLHARAALESVMSVLLSDPLSPDLLPRVTAGMDFVEFRPGDTLAPFPGLVVTTAPLRHPGGVAGFRMEWAGKVVAYATDTEHEPGVPDANVLRLAEEADILIYDASYTDEEFLQHRGWGHSSWQEGVRLADAARVGRLVLFHHAPSRTDDELDSIEAEAAARRPGTVAAREGLELAA